MDAEELKKRTKLFAHRCVKLALALPDTPLGRHIRNQLIRCETSVPANYRATCLAQSKAQFVAKLSIAIEEADESAFWTEFAQEEALITTERSNPLLKEAIELTNIFAASRKTLKNRKP
jgi:four helix bundle protein